MFRFKSRSSNDARGQEEYLERAKRHIVDVDGLRQTANPARLGFLSTDEIEPLDGLIGQERALDAVEFAVNIESDNFNIYALGSVGAGKLAAVEAVLNSHAPSMPQPSDWVYVHNFRKNHKPLAFELTSGDGPVFSRMMISAIDELKVGLPALFESEEYVSRRRAIDMSFESDQEDAFELLTEQAEQKDIRIMRTPTGFTMVPLEDGKIVEPETFNALPPNERKIIEAKVDLLERQLAEILAKLPTQQKERFQQLQSLNEDMAKSAITEALRALYKKFSEDAKIAVYLDDVSDDLIRHVGLFLNSETDGQLVKGRVETEDDPQFRRYMVNVMITSSDSTSQGAPIIKETNPTLGNLVGKIEHMSELGGFRTDFSMIKPGALHQANGGFLLIDAHQLLKNGYAFEALKRALKVKAIQIESPADDMHVTQPISLDPDVIPLNVKVILFGNRKLYYTLKELDPEFLQLFKIQADFDEQIDRDEEAELTYARLLASVAKRKKLRSIDSVGVARLIDESARAAADTEKLEINFSAVSDILEEANYWAGKSGHRLITHEDIHKTLKLRDKRASRMRDELQENILRDIQMVSTEGEVTGQINGLSVMQLGDFAFGRPNRITASVRVGGGRVVDIEREVELGGPLHSKGVMILWGYLAGQYALNVPLSLSASLSFEQSYVGVDGDSASSAELYALLSALADVPIKQGIAVTGSVNQLGEVQPIGGVNEKIEGFFDICKKRGLTGSQGVMIPYANKVHLMLRDDVVDAAGRGDFHIYAVKTINDGLEILTGFQAGERESDGLYPVGSVNRGVEDRLVDFAYLRRSFADDGRIASN